MMRIDRRRVLSHGACLAAGAGLGWLGVRFGLPGGAAPVAAQEADTPEHRLKKLGLVLPRPGKPRTTLAPAVLTGNLLFLSGHIAADKDGKPIVGKVGKDLTVDQGKEAARRAGLAILGAIRTQLGSLNRVVQIVKTLGMVNCAPDFTQQSQVIDAYSQLMIDVFGEKVGRGARSAVGVGSLPLGVAVEIECVVSVTAG